MKTQIHLLDWARVPQSVMARLLVIGDAEACRSLFDKGAYTAFDTAPIDESMSKTEALHLVFAREQETPEHRSLSVGDLVSFDDDFHVVMGMGFAALPPSEG